MILSRRALIKSSAAGAAAAGFGGVALASTRHDYRAVVAIDLAGGHDGWNMAVPRDSRYAAYAAGRGRALALPADRLIALGDGALGLHPAFAALFRGGDAGALAVVLNAGPLLDPIDKALYRRRPDLSPRNVMLHDDAAGHWRAALAGLGPTSDIPEYDGRLLVDRRFEPLQGEVAQQLRRVARAIETRDRSGEVRPVFQGSHHGYDTHADQVADGDPLAGRQADLYAELTAALAAFQAAMADLGLRENVTAFTHSEFGRAFKGNYQRGTDHAWGNNHLVLGGAVTEAVRGRYPDPTLNGPDDVVGDGRWLPSLSIENYLTPIMRWRGGDLA